MLATLSSPYSILLAFSATVLAAPSYRSASNSATSCLDFVTCPADLALPSDFECGTLAVPIDHDDTRLGTIDLFVSRRRANGTQKPLGNLFFNMGGPGAGAASVFQQLAEGLPAFGQDLLESYNIIAVDPRGIGLSNPLSCDKDIWNNQPKTRPTDEATFSAIVKFNKDFGQSCLDLSGPLVGYMDSISTMKDFELVRAALGHGPFNFLGYSYGTLLGSTYAELFPEHVGRMILDAAVDHSVGEDIYQVMTEGQTFQATLEAFFAWCDSPEKCSIAGQDLPAIIKNLTAFETVIPAPGCTGKCRSTVTGEDILASVQTALAFNDGLLGSWSSLADGISQAIKGDATAFSLPLAVKNTDPAGEVGFANRAVFCQDWTTTVKSVIDLNRIVDVASSLLPLTRGIGQAFDAKIHCVGWPAPVRCPPRKPNTGQMAKVPPMMVVNSFLDPESSAVWAESLRNQIPAAATVWRNGTGHTSYLLYGETSQIMAKFLLEGTLPQDGSVFQS